MFYVRNTDDHPRNHGFVAEPEGVSLSPLFDVVPALAQPGVGSEFFLATGVGREGRLASLANLCSAAASFNLSVAQARELGAAMQARVADSWRQRFSEAGFNDAELESLAPSFPVQGV